MGKPRKRTAGTGTVIVRPNGRFTAQISDGGRRRSLGTFDTRREAERAIARASVDGAPPAIESTLGDYLDAWLADQALVVKQTTLARDRTLIRCLVKPWPIARRRVGELAPEHFRALYRILVERGRRDGGPLAPGTIATLDQVLKAALQRLVDDRELRWHPMPRRVIRVTSAERPWLDLEQIRELIRFARFRDPDLEVVVRLGALGGLRRGEICGLRWSDLDLEAGTATIRRNRTVAAGVISESEPKTAGSRATIALDGDTVRALERHRARRGDLIEAEVAASEYVLCSASGGGVDPNNLGRSFRRLVDDYNETHPDRPLPDGVSLHALRHSFASNLVAGGVNLKVAAEAMRHSSTRMMDRYAHLAGSTVSEAVRSLAAEVGA